MGSRGPAPLPTALKLLHGERRAQRLNPAEPKPRAARPVRPHDLGPEASAVWRRVLRDQAPGVILASHREVLRAYCEAVAQYAEAVRLYAASGPLLRRGGALVKNPLHQIVRENREHIRLFARELGLTPSSLSGLHAAAAEREPSPAERFLRGRQRA